MRVPPSSGGIPGTACHPHRPVYHRPRRLTGHLGPVYEFDIGIATFIAPASVFIYPFVAQAIDMINEVYGRPMTRVAIAIALLSQILLTVLIAVTNSLTPAPVFAFEAAWQSIFTQGLLILLAP